MEPDKLIWGYIQAKKQLEWMKTQKGAWMKIQVYRQIIRGYEAKLKELTNAVN